MKICSTLVLLAALFLLPVPATLSADEPEAAEQSAESERQARIDAYLQKKEAKKAEKEAKKDGSGWFSRRKARRAETGDQTASGRRAKRSAQGTPGSRASGRNLEPVLDRLRNSAIMNTETGRAHIATMDQEGSPIQMAAFGSYLAEKGYLPASIALYKEATRTEPENPILWLNLGTTQMRFGQVGDAGQSFQKAIRLDPNNATAHYNLGAVYARSDYDKAIREFAIALTLNPDLGDPTINPQAANNDLLVPVKMMLYQSREGSIALPLVPVEGE